MGRKGGASPPVIVYIFVALIILNLVSKLLADPDFAEDFPLFAAIGAFLLFRFIFARNKKDRGPVPMPAPDMPTGEAPTDLGFKIPPLRGAPKEARAEAQSADADEKELRKHQSLSRHLAEKKAREEKQEQERLRREHQSQEKPMHRPQQAETGTGRFSADTLRNAMIWSEILAPPKALRKRVKG